MCHVMARDLLENPTHSKKLANEIVEPFQPSKRVCLIPSDLDCIAWNSVAGPRGVMKDF